MTGAFTPPPLAALLGAARRDRAALDRALRSLSPEAAEAWLKDWGYWGRADQQPPEGDDWDTWLILAGRGYGKTRTGAEWVRALALAGKHGRIALVAETAADARDVMVEG